MHMRRRYILGGTLIVLLGIGLYGLLPQLPALGRGWSLLGHAKAWYVLLAIAASLLSVACSALVYCLIAVKPLRYVDTLLVELSGLLVDRILPAGIGGLGLNVLYLRARQHTTTQAGTVAALNNTLGFVGHLLLAVVVIGGSFLTGRSVALRLPSLYQWLVILILFIALLSILTGVAYVRRWPWLARVRQQLAAMAHYYAKQPGRLLLAVVVSAGLTLGNVLGLWFAALALGLSVSFLVVFLVFTLGVAAGTATPTPGGLGGIEAALAAGLASQGIPIASAVAAALLFRLVNFWLGLPIGGAAYAVVRARRLIHVSVNG